MLTEEARRKIGGSDVGAILGVSRWKSPVDVWARIVHGEETVDNVVLRRGRRFEPVVLAEYEETTGAKLLGAVQLGFAGRPYLRASLDNVALVDGEKRVVEVKTVNFRMIREWGEGPDDVPMEYLTQVQWYMAASGLYRADVVALLGGCELRVYTLDADAELQGLLLEGAERFWKDYVLTETPPPADGSESYRAFLASKYPRETSPLLDATEELEDIVRELRQWEQAEKHSAEKLEECRNRLKALIGEAEGVRGSFGKVTWKKNKDSAVTDWKALCADLRPDPELVQKHTTTKPGARVFRASWAKETK